ncbi:hypothetical protein [Neptuniibacter sp. QD37_11]|uniref:hypothetical protein n=1 Tax=Neptuniibacter sp. QD37_11 TaxID=3398209 RepID=UPI0039F62DA4
MKKSALFAALLLASTAASAEFVFRSNAGMELPTQEVAQEESSSFDGTCETASVGDLCDINGSNFYYSGVFNGQRLYLDAVDTASTRTHFWGAYGYVVGVNNTDGYANTLAIRDAVNAGEGTGNPDDGNTNNAALACVNKGAGWYLPAKDEFETAFGNLGALTGSSTWYEGFGLQGAYYYASSEQHHDYSRYAYAVLPANTAPWAYSSYDHKNKAWLVRCAFNPAVL